MIGIRIGSDLAVKGSSSNGLDVPGVLSTCEPGLPSPPEQHNSKVFHKAGQHTNDHSYHHLYTLLLYSTQSPVSIQFENISACPGADKINPSTATDPDQVLS